jgi:hypothetical protein
MSAKHPHQMIIASPGGLDPEAETRVPCPACRKGVVTIKIAQRVAAAMHEPPPSVPRLISSTPVDPLGVTILPLPLILTDDEDE